MLVTMLERAPADTDRSRDTRENARLSFELARPGPGEAWVLVTSAIHLPRAVGAFEAAGWTVVPYPADYRTTGPVRWGASANVVGRLRELDGAVGEWVATVGYRVLGGGTRYGRTGGRHPLSTRMNPDAPFARPEAGWA